MPLLRTEGWILKEFPFGETSKILVAFTRKRGKVKLMAKGSRKPTSKLRSALEPYSLSELVLYEREGREFLYVREATTLLQPREVRKDLKRLSLIAKLTTLLERLLPEGIELQSLYYSIREILPELLVGESDIPLSLYYGLFLKILEAVGNKPVIERCVKCNGTEDILFFSIEEGGVLCKNCAKDRGTPISQKTLATMKTLIKWPLKEVKKLRIEPKEIEKILIAFSESQLGVQIKPLED
jgi:DNA repair protein RecO (recombination protein O)